jgi:LmbE family N-acetylglucosaminyl deacetylase
VLDIANVAPTVDVVLALAPHPDDEALGACGTLLQLADAGWRVVILACSLGRRDQADRRRKELLEACSRAGFELRLTSEPVGISANDELHAAEERLAEEIWVAMRELSPGLLVSPGPHDGHHGHEVVGRAARLALTRWPSEARPRWWLWELWSCLPVPTLYVGVPATVLERAAMVLAAHRDELKRNDYSRALSARAQLAAVLGAERVFGWGAPGDEDEFAEVLTEVLCDDAAGWPLAAPRRLDPHFALSDAETRGVDVGAWLAAPSPRRQILGGP